MHKHYLTHKYTEADVDDRLAHFWMPDKQDSCPFGHFHAHEYNQILVFITGGGNHNINFTNHTIEHHSIHLLAANDLHLLEPSGAFTGFAIAYKDQLLQQLQAIHPGLDFCHIFSSSAIWNLCDKQAAEFNFIFREIYSNSHQPAYLLQVIGTFIIKLASMIHSKPHAGKIADPIVPQLIKLVDQHFKTRMSVRDYAGLLNLTPRTLQNRFKKASSITIHKLLQQRRLKEAKTLLDTSQMNVGEISTELGFKEPAHFSNWFKKLANCVPLAYKYRNA